MWTELARCGFTVWILVFTVAGVEYYNLDPSIVISPLQRDLSFVIHVILSGHYM